MLKVLCTLCIFLRKFPICIVVRNWGRRKLKRRNLKLWICRANSLCVKVFCFLFILDFFSKKKYFSRCPRSQSYCPFPGQCKRLFHCSALGVQTHEFVVLCLSNGGTFSFCVILSLELAFFYNKCNLNRSLYKVFQIPFANLTLQNLQNYCELFLPLPTFQHTVLYFRFNMCSYQEMLKRTVHNMGQWKVPVLWHR